VRLVVTALVAFYVNYVPIHLVTATHLDDLLASVAEIAFHHHDHDEGEHHGDADHHIPHPASDHNLNFTAQTQASKTAPLAILCVLADIPVFIELPQVQHLVPVSEHIKPPGESPPGPLLPRAPPLA
jgi:hypothetical protein